MSNLTLATIQRIELAHYEDVPDPRGRGTRAALGEFLALPVDDVRTLTIYKIHGVLHPHELEQVTREFTDPVVEHAAIGRLAGLVFDWAVTVGFHPGVTDNLGRTARVAIEDTIGRPLTTAAGREGTVFTETTYLLSGRALTREDARRAGREMLANELIQSVRVESREEWYAREPDYTVPEVAGDGAPAVRTMNLAVTDEELLRVSRDGMLSLSLAEMKAIRDYFARSDVRGERASLGLPPDPTDVELECIAQTWSEHCKHKIMNAVIRYEDRETGGRETIRSLFKSYIRRVTDELGPGLGWLVSVFHDNAGVIRMNERLNLVYKVETHNSPSALDPYGGAITGIVGVNRDPFGTGRGASLLTNVWGYCFAPPDWKQRLPEGLLHPRRVRDGVHRGVIDGGNQSGIPYSRGWEYFDDRFLGKPLVFCGTVGVMPREVAGAPAEIKVIRPGDLIVMVGGRIGKDGIHGATFSSAELSEISPSQAVQIGDPITQKRMTDFLIEARDLGLYTAITDNGAGGLSSSVGEMCRLPGGAELDLARAPLKYEGLAPWEILLSEAQERMTLCVPPEHEAAFMALAARREVEATTLGTFTASGRLLARHGTEVVASIGLDFLHDGCPLMDLPAVWERPRHDEPDRPAWSGANFNPAVLALHGRLNLASNEDLARVYDHEVKGLSVVKPWTGARQDVPADATVMMVEHGSSGCVLLTEGVYPRLSDLDSGAMAAWTVDVAVRRAVAGGGRIGRLAGLDNYCWPDPVESAATPDGAYKCAQLVRATKSLYDTCHALRLPLVSGKDSMKNDSTRGGVKISVPPTLLVSVMGWIDDPGECLTLDAKAAGDLVYVVGETREELGGSEYWAWLGEATRGRAFLGNAAPRVDPGETRRACEFITTARDAGLLRSAHAPAIGGLAVGLARVALGGDLGLEIDLDEATGAAGPSATQLPGALPSDDALLFAECAGRFIVTVAPDARERLESLAAGHAVAVRRIGRVGGAPRLRIARGTRTLVDLELGEIRDAWQRPLALYPSRRPLPETSAAPRVVPAVVVSSAKRGTKTVRALVLTGLGLNCEAETIHGLATAGARVDRVHLGDVMAGDVSLLDYDILALIGGFAFGDHLGAGTVLANRFRYRLGDEFRRFIREGRLILAICNGFQAAVKMGILPGLDGDYETRRVTLAQNDAGAYRDSWVTLRANPSSPSVWTRGIDLLEVPVRHGEGKFFVRDAALLDRIERENLVALRYVDPATGEPAGDFPANPNGSLNAVAGMCDPTGRIFGLMPHPDAFLYPWNHPHWMRAAGHDRIRAGARNAAGRGNSPLAGAGLEIFRNGVEFARHDGGGVA